MPRELGFQPRGSALMISERIGVYGGTFDPVHIGHLRSALEAQKALRLDRVLMIPAGQPPHRQPPLANGEQRRRMLELALAGVPGLQLDDRELQRDGPSYMVDTLDALRRQHPHALLVLIVGLDAFLGLPQWHHWQRLLGLAHIAVMARPGAWPAMPAELSALLAERGLAAVDQMPQPLPAQRAGSVVRLQLTQLDISASGIREQIGEGGDPRFLVSDPVRDYLSAGQLYRGTDAISPDDLSADADIADVGLQRLDHLVLTVTDIAATVDFYRDVLGMRPVTFGAQRVALCFGPHKINLQQRGETIEPHAAQPTPGSADVCLISGVGMRQLQRHLQQLGVAMTLGPVARNGALGRVESLYFRDPDRNLIELSNYPA